MRKEQTAPPLYGAGLCGGRRGGAFQEGGRRGGAVSEAAFLAVGGIPLWDGRVAFVENGQRLFIGKDGRLLSLEKIGQFSKIRCNLPLYRIQYKYRAGPIDADGSSAYIFIELVILTCGGIEKTEKDEMRSTMSDMIG